MLRTYPVTEIAGTWYVDAADAFLGYETREEALTAAFERLAVDAAYLAAWRAAEYAADDETVH